MYIYVYIERERERGVQGLGFNPSILLLLLRVV